MTQKSMAVNITREEFEKLIKEAIQQIPLKIRKLLDNVEILVDDFPSEAQLNSVHKTNKMSLLGLYQGIPKTKRGVNYANVLPDRITLFQKPIEYTAQNKEDLKKIIKRVIIHELAHHFGFDETQARLLEKKKW